MRIVIAPDSFGGTLSAADAAGAMAEGWRDVRPSDEVIVLPMADGGEGTLDAVAAAVPGAEHVAVEVADAAGHATEATWLRLPDGRALVESAAACGLAALAPDRRDPLSTTSYGVGQLVLAAAAASAREIIVGVGGTATVDGGAGLATALGHRLRRADGNGVKVGARWLADLDRIVPRSPLDVSVVAAVDVTAPLLGPEGAVAVYAPQKGAGEEALSVLEAGVRNLADVAERDLSGGPWRDRRGAGAGGGLGFGLAAFAGARTGPGAALVADLVGLQAALARADVVLTGEGRLDAQTSTGKAPSLVVAQARAAGLPVLAAAGEIADGAGESFDAAVASGLAPDGDHAGALRAAVRRAATDWRGHAGTTRTATLRRRR